VQRRCGGLGCLTSVVDGSLTPAPLPAPGRPVSPTPHYRGTVTSACILKIGTALICSGPELHPHEASAQPMKEQNTPLKDEKYPIVESEINGFRNDCFTRVKIYRRRWAILQIVLIGAGALSVIVAGINVNNSIKELGYLLLVLTSVTTATNAIISTFRLGEMPLRYLQAGEELTNLLYSYRAEAALINDDSLWRPFEQKTRTAYRAIWAEVTRLRNAPPSPELGH
jgi:hypothetical protein